MGQYQVAVTNYSALVDVLCIAICRKTYQNKVACYVNFTILTLLKKNRCFSVKEFIPQNSCVSVAGAEKLLQPCKLRLKNPTYQSQNK